MSTRIPGFVFIAPYGDTDVHFFHDENEAHMRAAWIRRHQGEAVSASGKHSYDEVRAKLRNLRAEYVAKLAADLAAATQASA